MTPEDRQAAPETGSVESFDGTSIHYDYYDADASTLVLVIPGFWRHRRHPSMRRLGPFLNKAGFSTAIVDVRGHGSSGGRYGFNFQEHHDVAAVIQELVREKKIESVILLGFSVGGAIAVSTAARHALPIKGLLLISSVADFAMITPKINLFRLNRHVAVSQAWHTPRFDWRFRRSEKLNAAQDIQSVHVPVALIHVKEDWLIGHAHSLALFAQANEPKEMHLIDLPGNYHADRIFSVAGDLVEPIVLNFLTRTKAWQEPDGRSRVTGASDPLTESE